MSISEEPISKLICIKKCRGCEINKIYNGKYFSITSSYGDISEKWAVEDSEYKGYKMYVYHSIENFMLLSKWREQQINNILE